FDALLRAYIAAVSAVCAVLLHSVNVIGCRGGVVATAAFGISRKCVNEHLQYQYACLLILLGLRLGALALRFLCLFLRPLVRQFILLVPGSPVFGLGGVFRLAVSF